MKKRIQHFLYSLVGYSILFRDASYGAFGIEPSGKGGNVNPNLIGTDTGDTSLEIKKILIYFLGFLGLVAVAWGIKGGFQILTAADDEEKFKNGKRTVLFMLLGIVIILIAYSLVSGVIGGLGDVTKIEKLTP